MPDNKGHKGNGTLGIYVHIPFCVKKCKYCDFLSMPAGEECIRQYMDVLVQELEYRASLAGQYEIDSVFIGGGTPSVIDAQYIERIIDVVRMHYRMPESNNKMPEITIECNPGTVDESKLEQYRNAGINRISIGLQSASDEELRLLGRIHTWEQFEQSAHLVKQYFDNWNVDVMSALPGQTPGSYQNTLERVFKLNPPHISAYSLIIEEGTPFYESYREDELRRQKGEMPVVLPSEEAEREMYECTGTLMEEHGYYRYEISNYAKEGFESRHNNRYWVREDYLGIGLGASSLMQNVRWNNTSDMQKYLRQTQEGFHREEVHRQSRTEQMEETMFLGLRRMQGVDTEAFKGRFGLSVQDVYGGVLQRLELQKLIKYSGKYIQLTQLGIDVSNYVLAEFLLDEREEMS